MQIDFESQTKLYLGLYEVELNGYLRRLCRTGYDGFDVGGQSGYYALVIAKLTDGRVIAFECDAVCIPALHRNVAANGGFAERLSVRRGYVASKTDLKSHRIALDDFAYGDHGFIPDFMKIDVDGGELEVLRGAQRILDERHPHVIVETHSTELEGACEAYLRNFGYRPLVVDQRRWLRDHRPIDHNRWLVAEGTQ